MTLPPETLPLARLSFTGPLPLLTAFRSPMSPPTSPLVRATVTAPLAEALVMLPPTVWPLLM